MGTGRAGEEAHRVHDASWASKVGASNWCNTTSPGLAGKATWAVPTMPSGCLVSGPGQQGDRQDGACHPLLPAFLAASIRSQEDGPSPGCSDAAPTRPFFELRLCSHPRSSLFPSFPPAPGPVVSS